MNNHVFKSFSAVQIYDLSYIYFYIMTSIMVAVVFERSLNLSDGHVNLSCVQTEWFLAQ